MICFDVSCILLVLVFWCYFYDVKFVLCKVVFLVYDVCKMLYDSGIFGSDCGLLVLNLLFLRVFF